jgi:hypothetical protein
MLIHQLCVLPDAGTLDYFSRTMSACPFEGFDMYQMYVELNSSEYPMNTDPDKVYIARAGTMAVYYDSNTEQSSLILPLYSEEMDDRVRNLRSSAPSAFYGEHFFPFLVVQFPAPQLSRSNRSFIASISNTFASNNEPLVFEGECIRSMDFKKPPYLDYYNAMVANDVHNLRPAF